MRDLRNQLFVGALENARFGICVIDQSGRVVLANAAFANKIEVNVENILGQSYTNLSNHFGGHGWFHKLFGTTEPELSVECPRTKADGSKQYLLLQSSVLAHESGELFRIVSATEITDYGVTRDRFIELQRQFDAVNNSVVVVDAQADDMPITYVNTHFERMTGYEKSEIIGKNCRFLQGAAREQPAVAKLRLAIQKRESCHVTLKNFRKDGSEFKNELFISPVFDALGVLTHFVATQHEVSDRALVAVG